MGSLAELNADFYSDLRGLLPRIVEDVFKEAENLQAEKCSISCSFMEVYNEQIFDLVKILITPALTREEDPPNPRGLQTRSLCLGNHRKKDHVV